MPEGTATRTLRAVLLTGAATAVAVVGMTGPSSAATLETWDRLAMCESSGDWSINTGNGFYGGLQFSNATWQEFGGTEYAERADLATKKQQVLTAEKVLDVQGWNAWPGCSGQLGLTDADKEGEPYPPDEPPA